MNESLRNELISMSNEDQQVLKEVAESGELGKHEYHPKIKAVHERNNKRIKSIIATYGWPGSDLVGKDGSEAAWLLVQHAVLDTEFMESCLPLLRGAVKNKNAAGKHLAFLTDRVLIMSGQPQIYGTQFDITKDGKMFSMPIKNPDKVNKLRKEMGLEPLEKRLKYMQDRHDRMQNNKKG